VPNAVRVWTHHYLATTPYRLKLTCIGTMHDLYVHMRITNIVRGVIQPLHCLIGDQNIQYFEHGMPSYGVSGRSRHPNPVQERRTQTLFTLSRIHTYKQNTKTKPFETCFDGVTDHAYCVSIKLKVVAFPETRSTRLWRCLLAYRTRVSKKRPLLAPERTCAIIRVGELARNTGP
jgi:hypothetical protein